MNENLNLVNYLKNAPVATELYSPIWGKCKFIRILNLNVSDEDTLIQVEFDISKHTLNFYVNGRLAIYGVSNNEVEGECLLFPSKENHDWSTFKYYV